MHNFLPLSTQSLQNFPPYCQINAACIKVDTILNFVNTGYALVNGIGKLCRNRGIDYFAATIQQIICNFIFYNVLIYIQNICLRCFGHVHTQVESSHPGTTTQELPIRKGFYSKS